MRLNKFIKIMALLTILALTYIHMQMQIIDLAYSGNTKEQQIKKFIEENGSLTYKILLLKSVPHIGDTVLGSNSDLHFADNDDVVLVAASEETTTPKLFNERSALVKRTNSLLNLLSFGVEAEARPLQ